MNVHLSWDLFILVFFAVVAAYSFIIGRNQTLKVITATYVGILCSDGIGNLFSRSLAPSETFLKFLKLFAITTGDEATAFIKVMLLIVFVVIIAVRGVFNYDAEDSRTLSIRIIILLVLGILSAGLMLSAMLIFVSGASLISTPTVAPSGLVGELYQQSRFVKIMIDYRNIWFILPGFALVFMSLFKKSA